MTEQMQGEIADLTLRLEEIDDPRRSFAMVQERIRRLRQQDLTIPDELVRLERSLATECLNESQGR